MKSLPNHCAQIKGHIATSNRGLKWKFDMSAEFDALAEREADLQERHSAAAFYPENETDDSSIESSSVSLMLDLVFEFYPQEPGTSWFEHAPKMKEYKQVCHS